MSSLRLAIKRSLEGSGLETEESTVTATTTTTTTTPRPRPRISISLKPKSRIGSIIPTTNTNYNRQSLQQQQQQKQQHRQPSSAQSSQSQQQQQISLNTISIVMAKNKQQRQRRRSSKQQQEKLSARSRRRPPRRSPAVELPAITKCIRNSDPALIDEFGFVEVRNALPASLIEQIYREAANKVGGGNSLSTNSKNNSNNSNNNNNKDRGSRKRNSPSSSPSSRGEGTTTTTTTTTATTNEVEEISNALQTDVSEELFRKVKMAMEDCDIAKRTMMTVFGKKGPPTPPSSSSSSSSSNNNNSSSSIHHHPTNPTESNYKGYVLETPKVLITPPGSPPQLPHADDHCTSCVFCLIHLRDGQEPTRVARYRDRRGANDDDDDDGKDYPTGITVGCDRCNRTEQLPDKDFRRGVHLTNEKWHCNCTSPHTPYDFERKLTESFSELLSENAPDLCDAYAGPPSPRQSSGDGFLGLPTLIHRGPGNPTTARESRFALFLTLRPLYDNMKGMEKGETVSADKSHHHYNPALQIHASCMLYNQFKKVNSIYERAGCGLDGYFGAIVGAETASLMSEVKRLKEENRKLKEKIASAKKKNSRSGRDFDGDWTIDGG